MYTQYTYFTTSRHYFYPPILPLNLVYYQLKSLYNSRLITSLSHETVHSGTKEKTNIFLDKRTVAEGKFDGRVEAK